METNVHLESQAMRYEKLEKNIWNGTSLKRCAWKCFKGTTISLLPSNKQPMNYGWCDDQV